MKRRDKIAEEWAKLNDPGHTFSADLVLLYNRHMECALLHASFPRVLLASVPAAIKDGIGHTSTLEALPSFALTSARGGHQEIVCYPQILKYDPLLFQDKVCSMAGAQMLYLQWLSNKL